MESTYSQWDIQACVNPNDQIRVAYDGSGLPKGERLPIWFKRVTEDTLYGINGLNRASLEIPLQSITYIYELEKIYRSAAPLWIAGLGIPLNNLSPRASSARRVLVGLKTRPPRNPFNEKSEAELRELGIQPEDQLASMTRDLPAPFNQTWASIWYDATLGESKSGLYGYITKIDNGLTWLSTSETHNEETCASYQVSDDNIPNGMTGFCRVTSDTGADVSIPLLPSAVIGIFDLPSSQPPRAPSITTTVTDSTQSPATTPSSPSITYSKKDIEDWVKPNDQIRVTGSGSGLRKGARVPLWFQSATNDSLLGIDGSSRASMTIALRNITSILELEKIYRYILPLKQAGLELTQGDLLPRAGGARRVLVVLKTRPPRNPFNEKSEAELQTQGVQPEDQLATMTKDLPAPFNKVWSSIWYDATLGENRFGLYGYITRVDGDVAWLSTSEAHNEQAYDDYQVGDAEVPGGITGFCQVTANNGADVSVPLLPSAVIGIFDLPDQNPLRAPSLTGPLPGFGNYSAATTRA